jgi:NADH dehydrogenase [ubiquinone] 1 alpha subcomplex assembly factor 5
MTAPLVFDRKAVRRNRERAAARLADHEFLLMETAARLADRLDDITRRFPVALELGSRGGQLGRAVAGHGGIERLVQADLSPAILAGVGGLRVAADEELLPFAAGSLDAVLSNLALHAVNDLPGTLAQARRALKPDGLFLAAVPGGATLYELREAFVAAETALEGRASPRVAPFAEAQELGGLLQRAGFALPVVDTDRIAVDYPDAFALMRDLKGMGEANALAERRRTPTRPATIAAAAAHYAERFADPATGRVKATFDIVFLTAWAPAAGQPRPKARGSATASLRDALGGDTSAGSGGQDARPPRRC